MSVTALFGHGFRNIIILNLLLGVVGALASDGTRWSVLLLGGSGFRGHLTAELLLDQGHNVTILSRGRSYWGILPKLIKQGAQHWPCNRTIELVQAGLLTETTGLANCSHLANSTGTFFDVVVDFSSRTAEELKQAIRYLRGHVGIFIFISNHGVYDVAKNATHGDPLLQESDAVRPGREVSPLERYALKGKNPRGNDYLECEEELLKQYNGGGFPYTILRLANSFGPRENSMRYWLLHLWLRAHSTLGLPMHIDNTMQEDHFSMTYTPDIAQAVFRVIARARGETCCAEHVEGEAFNLACEERPNQRILYNFVAEPMGLNSVETVDMDHNKSIVLYPEIVRGPLGTQKALEVLKWTPTDLSKAVRSVARFYDRVMLDESKHKWERDAMYTKCKHMLGEDGPRFVSWIRQYYDNRRKTELYDELEDEDEDDIVEARNALPRSKRKRRKGKTGKSEL